MVSKEFLGYCSSTFGECLGGICKPIGASNATVIRDIALKVYHDDCKDVCGPQVDESCQNCMTSSAETHAKSLDISYSFFTTSRDSCPWYKAAACTAAILAAVPLCVDPVTFEVHMYGGYHWSW